MRSNLAVTMRSKLALVLLLACVQGIPAQYNNTSPLSFSAIPTVSFLTVPCGLALRQPIPGLNITFSGAVPPVVCNSIDGDPAQTLFGTFEYLDGDPSNQLTPPQSLLDVDNSTGQVIPAIVQDPRIDRAIKTPVPASLAFAIILADSINGYIAKTDTQGYGGYCVDARGAKSNNFTFTVMFTRCYGVGGSVFVSPAQLKVAKPSKIELLVLH